jgi:hypothetical protein
MDELWHTGCFVCHACGGRIHGREFTRTGQYPIHLHCKVSSSTTQQQQIPATTEKSPPLVPVVCGTDECPRTPNVLLRSSQDSTAVSTPPPLTNTRTATSPERSPAGQQKQTSSSANNTTCRSDTSDMVCRQCCRAVTELCVNAFGFHYHPECFACGCCGLPVLDSDFLSSPLKPYHKLCIANLCVAHLTVTNSSSSSSSSSSTSSSSHSIHL